MERLDDPADRRVRRVHLTDLAATGCRKYRCAQRMVHRFGAKLTEEEKQQVAGVPIAGKKNRRLVDIPNRDPIDLIFQLPCLNEKSPGKRPHLKLPIHEERKPRLLFPFLMDYL